MQLLAKGKWLNEEKRWSMVVALRRPRPEEEPDTKGRKPAKRKLRPRS